MPKPNSKPFLANVTTRENKTSGMMQQGKASSITGGAKKAASPSNKKKHL